MVLAAMLMPSESLSPAATVYRNLMAVAPPARPVTLAIPAYRVAVPMVSATRGAAPDGARKMPLKTWSTRTSTVIVSPRR